MRENNVEIVALNGDEQSKIGVNAWYDGTRNGFIAATRKLNGYTLLKNMRPNSEAGVHVESVINLLLLNMYALLSNIKQI